MITDEVSRLSEIALIGDRMELGGLTTDNYILTCALISVAEAKKLVHQINGIKPNEAIFWKTQKLNNIKRQKIIIRSDLGSCFGKLSVPEHDLRKITLGELGLARNTVDIPWLPSIKGYINSYRRNGKLLKIAEVVDVWLNDPEITVDNDIDDHLTGLLNMTNSKLGIE